MKNGLILFLISAALVSDAQASFVPEDERALADRLFMHWQTHATDVYVRGESVVGVGGARAEVPTVVLCGQRTHVTEYARPKLEELPRRVEDARGILLAPKDGGDRVWVPYGKTGCIIGSAYSRTHGYIYDILSLFEKRSKMRKEQMRIKECGLYNISLF